MRRWLFGFVCGALVFGALPLVAANVFRITPGGDAPLADRVQNLERAVEQLQTQVYGPAAAVKPATPPAGAGFTCAIETPFDGAFSANAPTEAAAREQTLAKCRARTHGKNSIYCSKSQVKCSG